MEQLARDLHALNRFDSAMPNQAVEQEDEK
jgi:hypothetical protein